MFFKKKFPEGAPFFGLEKNQSSLLLKEKREQEEEFFIKNIDSLSKSVAIEKDERLDTLQKNDIHQILEYAGAQKRLLALLQKVHNAMVAEIAIKKAELDYFERKKVLRGIQWFLYALLSAPVALFQRFYYQLMYAKSHGLNIQEAVAYLKHIKYRGEELGTLEKKELLRHLVANSYGLKNYCVQNWKGSIQTQMRTWKRLSKSYDWEALGVAKESVSMGTGDLHFLKHYIPKKEGQLGKWFHEGWERFEKKHPFLSFLFWIAIFPISPILLIALVVLIAIMGAMLIASPILNLWWVHSMRKSIKEHQQKEVYVLEKSALCLRVGLEHHELALCIEGALMGLYILEPSVFLQSSEQQSKIKIDDIILALGLTNKDRYVNWYRELNALLVQSSPESLSFDTVIDQSAKLPLEKYQQVIKQKETAAQFVQQMLLKENLHWGDFERKIACAFATPGYFYDSQLQQRELYKSEESRHLFLVPPAGSIGRVVFYAAFDAHLQLHQRIENALETDLLFAEKQHRRALDFDSSVGESNLKRVCDLQLLKFYAERFDTRYVHDASFLLYQQALEKIGLLRQVKAAYKSRINQWRPHSDWGKDARLWHLETSALVGQNITETPTWLSFAMECAKAHPKAAIRLLAQYTLPFLNHFFASYEKVIHYDGILEERRLSGVLQEEHERQIVIYFIFLQGILLHPKVFDRVEDIVHWKNCVYTPSVSWAGSTNNRESDQRILDAERFLQAHPFLINNLKESFSLVLEELLARFVLFKSTTIPEKHFKTLLDKILIEHYSLVPAGKEKGRAIKRL